MRFIALKSIEFYQRFLSPLLGGRCRFYPSCSAYAHGCFKKFGFFKALGLSSRRLLKCHPFHPGGLDPVPANGGRHG